MGGQDPGIQVRREMVMVNVWRPKESWKPAYCSGSYLSVDATSLDAGQDWICGSATSRLRVVTIEAREVL
ncbi:uncharacterized protein K441DRAFT_180676 [Cenococcum geophilum 1.58]|uniref:uncharacterized protein n=1 Tax=Cenococcum geophilum 1.58 TaxID=794803 RepID=UPI00358E5A61|nr:hypothetical protein K441DRAFT_180676 [Cenococcum geophilum 1.58]